MNYMRELQADVLAALRYERGVAMGPVACTVESIRAHEYRGIDCAAGGPYGREACGGCIRQRVLRDCNRVMIGDITGALTRNNASALGLEHATREAAAAVRGFGDAAARALPRARRPPVDKMRRKARRQAQRVARKRQR